MCSVSTRRSPYEPNSTRSAGEHIYEPGVPLHRRTSATHEPESTAQLANIGWGVVSYVCMCNVMYKVNIHLYTNANTSIYACMCSVPTRHSPYEHRLRCDKLCMSHDVRCNIQNKYVSIYKYKYIYIFTCIYINMYMYK